MLKEQRNHEIIQSDYSILVTCFQERETGTHSRNIASPFHQFVQRFVLKIPRLNLWYNSRHLRHNPRRICPSSLATCTSCDLVTMATICYFPDNRHENIIKFIVMIIGDSNQYIINLNQSIIDNSNQYNPQDSYK